MDCRLKYTLVIITLVVISFLLIWWSREDFEADRYESAVNITKLAPLMDKGTVTYDAFQRMYYDADPVEYFDVRGLHKDGRLNPANVYDVID